MPLQAAEAFDAPFTQADIPATAEAVRSATWDQALSDLPGASAIRALDLSFVRSLSAAQKYNPAEAEQLMQSRGLGGQFKFDRPYNILELNMLTTRKRAELARDEVLSRADGSGSSAIGRVGISLASQLLDPLAIGSAFVPVVGEGRYAALLARAGESVIARAGVRAGVGFVEGAAGAALTEPIIAGAKIQEQAEYHFADSFNNIVFGGLFGGGLHAFGGALADHFKLPSRELPAEAERVVARETPNAPEAADVGPLSGPLDVPDEYLDAANKLQAAISRARDIDLSNPAALSKIAGRQVLSISQFVRDSGGIVDDGGELSARDVTSKSMPGLVRKNGAEGADMDAVRQKLFDAGYFPEKRSYNEISDSEIYDSIANDLAGQRTYPGSVADLVARIHSEREFLDRLESQGISRGMSVDDIATKLRELDDEARHLSPSQDNAAEHFAEYESAMARATVEAADPQAREAAMRALVGQAVTGQRLEARPFFDHSTLFDAARRSSDPDQLPLSDPRAVDIADEKLAGGEPTEMQSVKKQLDEFAAQVKALQEEAAFGDGAAADELIEAVRKDFEDAARAGKDAKELSRAAAHMVACAMRHAV